MAEMRMPSGKVTATYAAAFRKRNCGEIKKGLINVRSGNLKGIIEIFSKHDWSLIKIREVKK